MYNEKHDGHVLLLMIIIVNRAHVFFLIYFTIIKYSRAIINKTMGRNLNAKRHVVSEADLEG